MTQAAPAAPVDPFGAATASASSSMGIQLDPASNLIATQRAGGTPTSTMPGVVAAAAAQPDGPSVIKAAAALKYGADTRDMLDRMDLDHQATAFNALDARSKQILVNVGYKPPNHSILATLAHPSEYLGDLLKAVAAPLKLVHRVINTGIIEAEQDHGMMANGQSTAGLSGAWAAAGDGNFVIGGKNMLNTIKTGLDPQYWDIALGTAQGENAEYLMGKFGIDAYKAATSAPGWSDAVGVLNGMKASPGRQIAMALATLAPSAEDKRKDFFDSRGVGAIAGHSPDSILSGGLDAVWSVLTDPLAKVTKAATAASHARYAIQDAEDVTRILNVSPAAQKGVQTVADLAKAGDYAGIAQQFPTWTGSGIMNRFIGYTKAAVADGAAIDSEHVAGFLKQEVGLEAMSNGIAPKVMTASPYLAAVPKVGLVDPVKLVLKNGIGDALDKLGNLARSSDSTVAKAAAAPVRSVARYLNGMSNIYMAHPGGFDPLGPDAHNVVSQVADLTGLARPQREELVNSFLAGDLAAKRTIYNSIVDQAYSALGSDYSGASTPMTAVGKLHQATAGALSREMGNVYAHDLSGAPLGVRDMFDGSSQALGLYEHQLSTNWSLPNLREIGQAKWVDSFASKALTRPVEAVAKGWGWGGDYGDLAQALSGKGQAFTKVWKAGAIFRPALGVRVGGEEGLGQIARDGVMPYLEARQAAKGVQAAVESGASTRDEILQWMQDNEKFWHVDPGAVSGLPMDRAAAVAYDHFGAAVAPPMKQVGMIEPTGIENALGHDVVGPGAAVPKRLQFTPTGDFKSISGIGNPNAYYWWQQDLAHIPGSQIHMAALAHPGDLPAATQAVEDLLNSEGMAALVKRAGISTVTGDGTQVVDDVTRSQAIHDWAVDAAKGTFGLTHDSNGAPIPEVMEMLTGGIVPGIKELRELDPSMVPQALIGRELVPHLPNVFDAFVNKGFEKVIDPMVIGLSRRPGFTTELAKQLDSLAAQEADLANVVGAETAAKLTEEKAMGQALSNFGKFIHNPDVRSAFEQMHPAITPFWFAKRQFYERWGRTIAANPYAVREGQLLMNGLRSMGVVTQDQNGDDQFSYPATGALQGLLHKTVGNIFGGNLPISVPFTSKVKFLSAGTAEGLMPENGFMGFGPFVSIPLDRLRNMFPEVSVPVPGTNVNLNPQGVSNFLQGPRGSGQSGVISQVVPSWMRSLFGTFMQNSDDIHASSNQMGSAMNYAIAQLASQGKMPAEDAPAGEKQQFINDVRNWARTALFTRAIVGMNGPAAPSLDTLGEVKPEYLKLLQTLPLDQAIATFMKLHPTSSAWTTFSTTAPVGGQVPLPANAAAGDFMSKNTDFMHKHGTAATWFIPSAPGGLDSSTYNTEFAMGLRERRAPGDFYNAVQTAGDSQLYYTMKDQYDAATKGLHGAYKTQLTQQWTNWKDTYLSTRPLFAEQLAMGGQRAAERVNALDALGTALQDPKAPAGPDTEAMSTLLNGYDVFKGQMQSFAGQRSAMATNLKRAVEQQFADWATSINNDRAKQVFTTLIKPGLPSNQAIGNTTTVTASGV